ncbi:MAG TPA: hypothetical protein VK631_12320 [Solirubrobacteraceae bacterium]|nr:hypothetical protein [Solirubrobacteraceae bacterium]
MLPLRKSLVAALAAGAVLAAGAPAADANPIAPGFGVGVPIVASPGPGFSAAGPCSDSRGTEGQGGTARISNQVCMGSGLSFVGPAVAQIASVVGPTIIGPSAVGTVIVSAGNAAAGP